MEEGAAARLTQAVAIGSTAFLERLRRQLARQTGAWTNARAWRRFLPFQTVVRAVETLKRERWQVFADRRGDWGRDLALYVGRRYGGLTLQELGTEADMTPPAVSKAAARMRTRLATDCRMQRLAARVLQLARPAAEGQAP